MKEEGCSSGYEGLVISRWSGRYMASANAAGQVI
jgi:hypothetical protein